jgi:hypothetical protein
MQLNALLLPRVGAWETGRYTASPDRQTAPPTASTES